MRTEQQTTTNKKNILSFAFSPFYALCATKYEREGNGGDSPLEKKQSESCSRRSARFLASARRNSVSFSPNPATNFEEILSGLARENMHVGKGRKSRMVVICKVANDINILDLRTRYRTKLDWFFRFFPIQRYDRTMGNGKFCISEPHTDPNWVGSFGSARCT